MVTVLKTGPEVTSVFSVRVSFAALAASVGVSLTGSTLTVETMLGVPVSSPPLAVPPLSTI